MPKLAITLPDGTTTEVEVALPFFSIGRGREATIQVRDRALSKRHAKFFRTRFGYHVVDVGSRNGTVVNGTRVTEQLLRPGDRLQLGKIKVRWIEDEMAGETRPPMPREVGEGAAGTCRATGDGRQATEFPNPEPRPPSPGRGGRSPPPDMVEVEGFESVDAGIAPPPPPRARPERAPEPAVAAEADVLEIRAVPEVWPSAPQSWASPAALEPLPFFEAVQERPAGADAIDAALARIRAERGDSSRARRWWEKELSALVSFARARGRVPALAASGFVVAAFLLVTTSRLASDHRWVEGSEEVLPGLVPEDEEPAASPRGGEEEAFRRAVLLARSEDADSAAARDALAAYLARYPASPRRPEVEAELARLERRALALAAAPGAERLAYAERAHARGELLVALEAYELAARTSEGEESRQAARRAAELREALRARFQADRRRMEEIAREGNSEEARLEFERLTAEYPLPEFVEEARRALGAALAGASPG
ncbi:MAG: FHA domain-containing protein, partial [Planctomycetes bacterium]|nr:FHA domain-containing protein [Planctomycetota bacterium]